MERKEKLLGFYNYTVVLTYIGMLTGFRGIVFAFEQQTTLAVVCLMIAGACDMFDGKIASTMKRTDPEKCFGIQIDSLSDLICFGVLPAAITYSMNRENALALLISGGYVLCALIRLAYFNVDEQDRQKKSTSRREVYQGMPVTLSAVFLPITYRLILRTGSQNFTFLSVLLVCMGVLFLLPFEIRKPKILVGEISEDIAL